MNDTELVVIYNGVHIYAQAKGVYEGIVGFNYELPARTSIESQSRRNITLEFNSATHTYPLLLTMDDAELSMSGHTHTAQSITSGVLDINRLPVGTTSGTVASGNHTHSSLYGGDSSIVCDAETDELTVYGYNKLKLESEYDINLSAHAGGVSIYGINGVLISEGRGNKISVQSDRVDITGYDDNGDSSMYINNVQIGEFIRGCVGTTDWNAKEGETGYIKNKPFGEIVYAYSEQPVSNDVLQQFRIDFNDWEQFAFSMEDDPENPTMSTGFRKPIMSELVTIIHNVHVADNTFDYFGPYRESMSIEFADHGTLHFSNEWDDTLGGNVVVAKFDSPIHGVPELSEECEMYYVTYDDYMTVKKLSTDYISNTIARKEYVDEIFSNLPTVEMITQVASDLDDFKSELEISGTVHNAERIGGLTINEIVEQLGTGSGSGSGSGGNFSPTYKDTTYSVPLIAYELNKAVYSDVMMTKDQVWAPGGFFQKSDERLKNFVEDIEVDLDKIALLPKKYFYWKDDVNGGKQIGTSAQAVKELYPEMVSEGEDGLLNVDYDKLIVVALKAIDILNDERKQMKSDIQQIKDKLGL